MAIPAAPTATDAQLAAAIARGIATGDLIELTPDVLAAMAPATPSPLSDVTIETLLRVSKLAQSAGDTTEHHELMAQIAAADRHR